MLICAPDPKVLNLHMFCILYLKFLEILVNHAKILFLPHICLLNFDLEDFLVLNFNTKKQHPQHLLPMEGGVWVIFQQLEEH